MKTFLGLIVLFAVIYTNWAAVSLSARSEHPDYPNQCYVESLQKAYTVGEHTPVGNCVRVLCKPDLTYHIATCGIARPAEGYHIEYDTSKSHPECCGHFVKNEK